MDLGFLQYDIFNSIGFKPLQCMAVLFDPDKYEENQKEKEKEMEREKEKKKETGNEKERDIENDKETKEENEGENGKKNREQKEKEKKKTEKYMIEEKNVREQQNGRNDIVEIETDINNNIQEIKSDSKSQLDRGSSSRISTAFSTPLPSPLHSEYSSCNTLTNMEGMAVAINDNLNCEEGGGEIEWVPKDNESSTSTFPSSSSSSSSSSSPLLSINNDWQFIYNIEIWHDRSLQFQEQKLFQMDE